MNFSNHGAQLLITAQRDGNDGSMAEFMDRL
jgi:hypothetical protein